jgi:hypothetical protein
MLLLLKKFDQLGNNEEWWCENSLDNREEWDLLLWSYYDILKKSEMLFLKVEQGHPIVIFRKNT